MVVVWTTNNARMILKGHIISIISTCASNKKNKKTSLLIYDLQSDVWINTYYMLKDFLKARSPPKASNEMKCTNEKMTWNTQHTNRSRYVPTTNVHHTISGQGTVIITLDHSATTPRANMFLSHPLQKKYTHQYLFKTKICHKNYKS